MTTAALPRASGPSLRRVYVWDLVVRSTHWLIALSILLLAVSGIYMGHPFLTVPGRAGDHFVMGTMKAIHFYAAILFVLSVLSRLLWMLVGPPQARWSQFLPVSRERLRGLWPVLRFYTLVSARPPKHIGHNPLAGLFYSFVFVLYLVQVATGLGLYGMRAYGEPMGVFAPLLNLFGGPQSALWIHHVVMWLLLGFVAHHVASAVLVARVERNGTVDSIVSGYKFVEADAGDRDGP